MKNCLCTLCAAIALLVSGTAIAGDPIGRFDTARQTWMVDTGTIQCEFFEGCMFPTGFRKDSSLYPNFSLLDQLTFGKEKFYLKDERWAEVTVRVNTPEMFRIECRGHFGRNGSPRFAVCENAEAVYTYVFRRGSGKVEMQSEVAVRKGTPVKYSLFLAGWLGLEFRTLRLSGRSVRPVLGKRFTAADGGSLECPMGTVILPAGSVIAARYMRYDKQGRIYQSAFLESNAGELKAPGKITAAMTLEFR